MQKTYRIVQSLLLGLILLTSTTRLSAQYTLSSDSLDQAPLTEAERLKTLRDKNIIIAPNPYYSSTLSYTLPVQLINRKAPTSSPFIKYKKTNEPSLSLIPTSPSYKVQPVAVDGFVQGLAIDYYNLLRIQLNRPELIRKTQSDLLAHQVDINQVGAEVTALDNIDVVIAKSPTELQGKSVKRKYWKFGLESILQFSQNYISKNWHQGGGSNLNLYNKQLFRYDYNRDKIAWNNEMEWRLSIYTSAADTVSKYRVAEDILRFRSNIGLQAWGNFFYSIDGEIKTSLFTRREENKTEILSALFSPVIVNVGVGIKYVLDKKFDSYYGRRLRITANLSPLSFDFRYSYKTNGIDLKRHGFADGKNIYKAIGSTFRIESIFDYSQTISWQSRFLYNTSYHRIETEWENSINFAFTQYFSTRINVVMRYDDAVPITPENRNPLQINELFSLGFRYLL